ncbi:MAG: hypothetical protein ABIQ89_03380 [Candidatus Saccharimonadales bacterium]
MEPLPEYYSSSRAAREFGETNPNRAMLENLRADIGWNPNTEAVMGSLYSASRIIGDSELYAGDSTGQVALLLEPSRPQAAPEAFNDAGDGVENSLEAGSYNEVDHLVNMNMTKLLKHADSMVSYFDKAGEPLKNPADAHLFMILGVASHESGHVIMSGLSKFQRQVPGMDVDYSKNLATRTFLGANPDLGFTGNWDTDVQIHEERFAEGYSQMVLRKAMETLGYEPDHIERIAEYLTAGFSWKDTHEGEHQLDHIEKVSADSPINKVMEAVVSTDELIKTHQHYLGDLGYSAPLTPEDMISQFQNLHLILKDREAGQANPTAQQWEEKVRAAQSSETKAIIEGLREKRANELQMQKEAAHQQAKLSRRRRLVGGISLRGSRKRTNDTPAETR